MAKGTKQSIEEKRKKDREAKKIYRQKVKEGKIVPVKKGQIKKAPLTKKEHNDRYLKKVREEKLKKDQIREYKTEWARKQREQKDEEFNKWWEETYYGK